MSLIFETEGEEKSSKTLKLSKSKSGILFGEIISNTKISLTEAKENSALRASYLDEEHPIPYICNIKNILSADSEARKFMSQDTMGISCAALIVDSGISKIIGDYALWVNKPSIPIKLFTDMDEAVFWVTEQQFNYQMKGVA